ncbi:hypothetical protein ONZ45_g104 [Pleurotus djamor]|nr:hypothetical protein ONZ45_g104 [Pleurotus djamor]
MDPDWDSVLQFVTEPCPPSSQIPTPPESHDSTPAIEVAQESHDDNTLVSVSTTFFPGAQTSPLPADIILLASDAVFFYVHSHILLAASDNAFRSILPASQPPDVDPPIVNVPDTSPVLNVILHAAYDMSCAHYSPPIQTLVTAVQRLPYYGISPRSRIYPSTPLYTLLLSYGPLHPLDIYALAASLHIDSLAVAVSSHLLGFHLSSVTDDMARQIGPVYLKRLFFLHFGRIEALKRILLPPPHPHPPTSTCDFVEQKKLTRAWALASAYFAWDARPDVSTSTMESALKPLEDHLTCDQCRLTLKQRIKDVIVQWSIVKVSPSFQSSNNQES